MIPRTIGGENLRWINKIKINDLVILFHTFEFKFAISDQTIRFKCYFVVVRNTFSFCNYFIFENSS